MTQGLGYVDPAYLDAAARLVAAGKRLSYDRMRISPGAIVLDVGCGPGSDTIPLAGLVGESGFVHGIDRDAEMAYEATRRAFEAGVADCVEHRVGDAYELPWRDGHFDAVRCERLFLHLDRPGQATGEMVRVTKPGGRVVLMDTDWGTRSVDTPEVDLERRIARVLTERCMANGYSGRRLWGLMKAASVRDLTVDLVPLHVDSYELWRLLSRMEIAFEEAVRTGAMTAAEVRRLDDSFRDKEAAGTFFASTTVMLVAGTKG